MSLYKVTNYNLSYEMLLDAAEEFSGFITGVGVQNDLFTFTNVEALTALNVLAIVVIS